MTNHKPPYAGRCLCGGVRIVAREAPLWAAHCHCRSCRLQTASLMASFVGFRDTAVSFEGDCLADFESSPGVRRSFCSRCGTPVAYRAGKYPGEVHLYIAAFDDATFAATRHALFDEHVDGFEVYDDLPRYHAGSREPASFGPARDG